ncbi:uncharacterized protein MKK02DRAFT_45222 [Dioszegia hungarica]|uniref:C3H1-type domain-containing protein n=1 Tax=Dioszegia hungarica TaxID=4972 RepID=A0AA38HCQ7_9TREE|nr:uncharacterized protein MKK02DRAFT_45222 [Dioszegia hungarica]KAI9636519.1 hypothetical protein MKK02DRAFT_45222 [Dioszegia hungarica]
MYPATIQPRHETRQPPRRHHYAPPPRARKPAPTPAYHHRALGSHAPSSDTPHADSKAQTHCPSPSDVSRDRAARSSFSSSESSFGSAQYATHQPLPVYTRPRLASVIPPPVSRYLASGDARDPPPHHSRQSTISFAPSHTHQPSSTLRNHLQTQSRLPDLRNIHPHAPDIVAARRRLEDSSTKPFSFDPPPYSDHDVPLPTPYNAAYPHPLTAYASPGVNFAAIRDVQWRDILHHLMETDIDLVKGTILASSDRDINPPALMIPVFEGEGCGIPERLWSRFESMGDLALGGSSTHLAGPPSAPVPPRFTQAGLHVVATPGGRAPASLLPSLPADGFPAVRTNFSNVLRRSSTDTESARTAPPPRRAGPQPTPFHKTELCRTWEHEGICKYGSNCQFAHGLLELRMPVQGMPTPPVSHSALAFRTDTITSYEPRQPERRGSRPIHLDYIGEHDSPLLHARPRLSTPSPIGAEKDLAWKTVPVPESLHSPFSFTQYTPPIPISHSAQHHPPTSAIPITSKSSFSSLSASAASFKTSSTPSGSYSYSTSTSDFCPSSSYTPTVAEHDIHGGWIERLTATPSHEHEETPDWEMLKRSIDATTVRSVWEE